MVNMLGGTELIRRKLGKNAYAMTITLLMIPKVKRWKQQRCCLA